MAANQMENPPHQLDISLTIKWKRFHMWHHYRICLCSRIWTKRVWNTIDYTWFGPGTSRRNLDQSHCRWSLPGCRTM